MQKIKHPPGFAEIKVHCELARPLVLHNPVALDTTHPWSKMVKAVTAQKKKMKKGNTDLYKAQILKLQWCCASYWDADAKSFYLPSDNIEKGLKEAAAKDRLGRQAEVAVQVVEAQVFFKGTAHPLEVPKGYKSPTPLDDLEMALPVDPLLEYIYDISVVAGNQFVLKRPVRIPPRTGARVPFHRPMIPVGCTFDYTILVDTGVLGEIDTKKAALDLGYLIGLGAWRPKFGRLNVTFPE